MLTDQLMPSDVSKSLCKLLYWLSADIASAVVHTQLIGRQAGWCCRRQLKMGTAAGAPHDSAVAVTSTTTQQTLLKVSNPPDQYTVVCSAANTLINTAERPSSEPFTHTHTCANGELQLHQLPAGCCICFLRTRCVCEHLTNMLPCQPSNALCCCCCH